MMYVALLRGINVGGRNIIRMAALKQCFEQHGLERVATFIQSGNVIFASVVKDGKELTRQIEAALSQTFNYESRVMVRSRTQLRNVLANVPRDWIRRTDLRCYVAFLREPVTAKQVLAEVDVAPGIDVVEPGNGVVYMSTLLSGVTRSGLRKMLARPIYQDMTIRNYSTCQKILALMNAPD